MTIVLVIDFTPRTHHSAYPRRKKGTLLERLSHLLPSLREVDFTHMCVNIVVEVVIEAEVVIN